MLFADLISLSQIGLLEPEHVDKFTGYRYYTLNQLPRAHRIMALKEMALSLEQIGIMLNEDMTIDELRGMFRLKQAETEQRLREEQKRLAMIEFHLHMIEMEGNMPDLDVVMKDIDPFKALYIRMKPDAGNYEITGHNTIISTTGEEVYQALEAHKVVPISPQVDVRYGDEINIENYEYAFAFPVDDSVENDIELPSRGTMVLIEMPPIYAATVIFKGKGRDRIVQNSLERLTLLRRWVVENQFTPTDEIRIVHHIFPNENDWLMEFQVVVETISS